MNLTAMEGKLLAGVIGVTGSCEISNNALSTGHEPLLRRIAILCCSMFWVWALPAMAEQGAAGVVQTYAIQTRHSDDILPPNLGVKLLFPEVIDFREHRLIHVQDTTQNFGCKASVPSVTRYYLSETPDLNLDKAYILGERHVPALPPGEENHADQDNDFVLPAQAPAGRYYLFACADARHDNVQINERNHCSNAREFVQYDCGRRRTEIQQKNLDDLGTQIFVPKLTEKPLPSTIRSKQLLSRFGNPLSTKVVSRVCPGTSASEGRCDYGTWKFTGMKLETVAFISTGKQADQPLGIRSITITDARYPLVHGLRVGLPRAAFIEQLGKPNGEYKRSMSYTRDDMAYSINIEWDMAVKIKQITWEWLED